MSGKISQFVAKTKKVYGDVFTKYPITMILVIITTIYSCVFELITEYGSFDSTVEDSISW